MAGSLPLAHVSRSRFQTAAAPSPERSHYHHHRYLSTTNIIRKSHSQHHSPHTTHHRLLSTRNLLRLALHPPPSHANQSKHTTHYSRKATLLSLSPSHTPPSPSPPPMPRLLANPVRQEHRITVPWTTTSCRSEDGYARPGARGAWWCHQEPRREMHRLRTLATATVLLLLVQTP